MWVGTACANFRRLENSYKRTAKLDQFSRIYPIFEILLTLLVALPLIADPFFYAVAIPAVLLLGISKSGLG